MCLRGAARSVTVPDGLAWYIGHYVKRDSTCARASAISLWRSGLCTMQTMWGCSTTQVVSDLIRGPLSFELTRRCCATSERGGRWGGGGGGGWGPGGGVWAGGRGGGGGGGGGKLDQCSGRVRRLMRSWHCLPRVGLDPA